MTDPIRVSARQFAMLAVDVPVTVGFGVALLSGVSLAFLGADRWAMAAGLGIGLAAGLIARRCNTACLLPPPDDQDDLSDTMRDFARKSREISRGLGADADQ